MPAAEPTTEALLAELASRVQLLRETAKELRTGKINQYHAANRIDRIANEICREERKS